MSRKHRRHQFEQQNLFVDEEATESRFKIRPVDLKQIEPLTHNQAHFFNTYSKGRQEHFVLYGTAGSGKTLIALYNALKDVLSPNTPYKKVIIVRSAVPSRDIGHLPGDEKEKTDVYAQPYKEMCQFLLPRFGEKAFMKLKEQGLIEFMITSYVRGLTFEDAIVVFDEFQNATWQELNSVITRVGQNCKMVLCGDIRQNDLVVKKHDQSGFKKFMTIANHMDEFEMIEFLEEDIVRSGFLKSWVIATNHCEDLELI